MSKKLEYVKHQKKILAIILKKNFKKKGISFFTPNEFSQQLGYMSHDKNHEIQPHYHKKIKREIFFTQETLIIKKGKLRVDFYSKSKKYLKSRFVSSGDILLLVSGGHGFKTLSKTEMIEIKQGPYWSDKDKIQFKKKKIKVKK
tara:strand:- start:2491 stop:2922 length:432 start_codon:yes stop_codon:yes gene_type:complete